MGLFKKKEKKELEPQYYMSPTHIQTLNYKVYYFSKKEKLLYFILAFIVGASVGYLFYGGIGKDEYGNPTMVTNVMNIIVIVTVGTLAGKMFLPIRQNQIINKRRKMLSNQFRDMLDGITTSLGAGNNVLNSFNAVYNDLKVQYDEGAYIIKELEIILSGVHSNFNIEDLLADFGKRSGVDDIESFANVFKICYRKGGNIKDVIQNTHAIISQKMEMQEDIETTLSGNKMDQMIMIVMPIALIGIIKMMSPEFGANYATLTGVASTTIAIVFFVAAYYIGKTIMDIKV